MDMVTRIRQKAMMILVPLAVAGLFFDYKRIPVSILLGGAIGLVNLKAIQWGVNALIRPEDTSGAKGKLVFFSMLRLLGIFVILAVLLKLKLINILAVLTGLTVVFVFIIFEGFKESKNL
jgi:hypothetical protein